MNKWIRRFLALITLMGSIYGLSHSIFSILELNATGGGMIAMVIAAVGTVFFLFGLMTAFWLLEGTPKSVLANSVFWALQLPAIITTFLTYKVYAMGSMAFATDPAFSGFGFPTNGAPLGAPESRFDINMGAGAEEISLGLNLFALFMLVLLIFARSGKQAESSSAGTVIKADTVKKASRFGFGKAAKLAGGAAAVTGGAVAATAKSATSVAGDVAGGAVDLAGSAASTVADGIGAVADGTMDAAGAAASVAGDVAGASVDAVSNVVTGAVGSAGDMGTKALDIAKEAVEMINGPDGDTDADDGSGNGDGDEDSAAKSTDS